MVKREKNGAVRIDLGPPEPQEHNGRASNGFNTLRTNQIAPTQMRIAMAWPQSCVSAYYVVYAEDPENPALGSAIRNRLRELERSPGSSA